MSTRQQSLVESAFARDFQLAGLSQRVLDEVNLVRLSQFLASANHPVVYTAFDGDHFAMTPLMRSYALARGHVPANPESILGYKDTVDRHQNKTGVLRDDLAVLRACDELWVFTDEEPSISSMARLAEGVLVEILYFVLSRGTASVGFVPVGELLMGGNPEPALVELSADTIASALPEALHSDLLRFLGGANLAVKTELPSVAFIAMDPLDSKYMSWLRPYALNRGQVAVVPGLAVELGDVVLRQGELGCLLVSWTNLMKLAGELWIMPPMELGRAQSNTVSLLVSAWEARRGHSNVRKIEWDEVRVPKAQNRRAWPITRREGGVR